MGRKMRIGKGPEGSGARKVEDSGNWLVGCRGVSLFHVKQGEGRVSGGFHVKHSRWEGWGRS
jgi:hypothetical protein